jgi:hypothetical protein
VEKVSLVLAGQAINSLRESDFDTCSAVGEVIDNSIQAGATEIHLIAKEEELPARGRRKAGTKVLTEVAFGDNGHGMGSETLHRCMQLGFSTRYDDRCGIGRFGVGMTLGAINQCARIEVYSKEKSENAWLHTHVDLHEALADPYIAAPKKAELPKGYSRLVGKDQGTLVVWSKFDRQPQSLPEIEHWLARTYRKFIGAKVVENGKVVKTKSPIVLTVNKREVVAFDPLYAIPNSDFPDDDVAKLFEPIEFEMPIPEGTPSKAKVAKVRIQMSLTPTSWRPEGGGKAGRSELARTLYITDNDGTDNQGFSVLRANREVFYDTMPHFNPAPHADGLDRWWSAEISFDPVLDKYFSVRNIKRGARFVKELREKIQEDMRPTIFACREAIQKTWAENKNKSIHKDTDVSTEHTPAEKTVKDASPTPGKAGSDKTPEEKEKEIKEILRPLVESGEQLEAWRAKIESQPCTIVDNEGTSWKGNTFLDIHPYGGKTIIEYNMTHEFFLFVYGTIKELTANTSGDNAAVVQTAKKLKLAIDLLFMSYAQAESVPNQDHQQRIADTLDMLRNNWGTYLAQYVRTFEKTA